MNIDYDGEREIVWDVAVACLALSVKFHRDVLSPLYPVLADEFLLLSPNEMTYEDLESAQRDVFAGLDFNLGSFTPEAYMSEFYDALPSLRKSVQFKGGWDVVRKDTWSILLKTLHDINYLQFPISLLTASALVLSLTRTLTLKARIEQATVLSTRVDKWKPSIFNGSNCDCERLRRGARKVVRAVELDLREILGVEIESWRRCRRWIHEVSEV
ncbi:hypothetical protein C8Q75DRAFT_746445 [Abortiporus biennis]|nr:hypothetical protein C8Q75DRAFT_746445 [Abortiporus biennis]